MLRLFGVNSKIVELRKVMSSIISCFIVCKIRITADVKGKSVPDVYEACYKLASLLMSQMDATIDFPRKRTGVTGIPLIYIFLYIGSA